MRKKPIVMVALDDPTPFHLAEKLAGTAHNIGFKINLDFIAKVGIKQVAAIMKDFGRPLFGDVKLWNGARTMQVILDEMEDSGYDYANVHLMAGPEIKKLKARQTLKLLGVALLTHYGEDYGKQWMAFQDTRSAIVRMSYLIDELSLDGIITRADCLGLFSDNLIKVSPGIRPVWYQDNRQHNPLTPVQAIGQGADILVVGSPITKANDPMAALDMIFREIDPG